MIFNIHVFTFFIMFLVCIHLTNFFFPFNYIHKVIKLWIKMLDLFRECLKKNRKYIIMAEYMYEWKCELNERRKEGNKR